MTTDDERAFHRAMVEIYHTAKRDIGYVATRFIQMVGEHGGLAAAQRLLAADVVSDGFVKLWEHSRLDLSVEAHVLDERFSSLFTHEERRIARERLERYEYPV